MAKQVDKFFKGQFRNPADPKDGYTVRDLRDPDVQIVVGFLYPIFHSEKPKRLVSLWVATFIGCFRGKLVEDWTHLLANVVK